jgi:hypothetical protein
MTELPDDMEAVVERISRWANYEWTTPDQIAVRSELSTFTAGDLRALLLAYQERGRALEVAAKYLCRLEGSLLADDLDMRLNFPGEPSPTAMAESILPGFDSIEYDLARAAINQKGKSHE